MPEQPGKSKLVLRVVALLAAAVVSSAGTSGGGPDLARSLIPSAEDLPGWSRSESVVVHGPDTLYEYIDGAARMYLDFGFVSLAHVRFAAAGETGAFIDLDVYQMKDELAAYGIYSNTRPPDAAPEGWGVEGYLSGMVAAAWKGPIYVHAETESGAPGAAAALKVLVAGVTSAIPGKAEAPRQLHLLPAEGRLANGDRYVGRDLMGHFFLPGGFLADYEVDGQELRLFLVEMGSKDTAFAAWSNLREYERRQGRDTQKLAGIGDDGFRAVDPGLGPGIVARTGRYVAGVWGGPEGGEAARRLLDELVANLAVAEAPEETSEPKKH